MFGARRSPSISSALAAHVGSMYIGFIASNICTLRASKKVKAGPADNPGAGQGKTPPAYVLRNRGAR